MRKKILNNIIIYIFLTVLLFGCDLTLSNNEEGSLTLNLGSLVSKVTISPNINMEISYYSINGVGPNNKSVNISDTNEQIVTIKNLLHGNWTFTVTGYNLNMEPIGEGSVDVEIIPNQSS